MDRVDGETLTPAETARRAMIDCQLRPSGVNDPRILGAIARTPRENFVPEALREIAYIDRPLDLGNGKVLPDPLVHGRMLIEAEPSISDKALLIGDGQGYLAALLRSLVGSLDSLDVSEVAGASAADYSLIILDGAAEVLPDSVAGLLAEDGRLITGTVEKGVTSLSLGRKSGDSFALWPLLNIGMPVLKAFAAPKTWSF